MTPPNPQTQILGPQCSVCAASSFCCVSMCMLQILYAPSITGFCKTPHWLLSVLLAPKNFRRRLRKLNPKYDRLMYGGCLALGGTFLWENPRCLQPVPFPFMYVEKEERRKNYHMEKCQRIGYMKDMSPASAFFIYVIYSKGGNVNC